MGESAPLATHLGRDDWLKEDVPGARYLAVGDNLGRARISLVEVRGAQKMT